MRHRVRYTATMEPTLLSKLDLDRGQVPRSQMIEGAVRILLEQIDAQRKLKALYESEPATRVSEQQ